MTRPTPKQREALAARNRRLDHVKEEVKAQRRRYWLIARIRENMMELGIESREVADIIDEVRVTRRAAASEAELSPPTRRERATNILTSTVTQPPAKVADAISTLLPPPPPAPMEWRRVAQEPAASQQPVMQNVAGGEESGQ